MVRAAGGLVSVTDIPVMGTPVDIVANTAGGYTAELAQARLFVGGTHVILSGIISRPQTAKPGGGTAGLQRAVTIGTIPEGLRPAQTRRVTCAMGNAAPGSGGSGTTAVQITTAGSILLTANADTIEPQTIAYLDAIMYAL
jgi:hypothetical protein